MTEDQANENRDARADDRYLWDRGGQVDPDIAKLERTLEPLRYEGEPPALPDRIDRPLVRLISRPTGWRALAAAAVVVLAVGLTWVIARSPGAGSATWEIASIAGGATIDTDPLRTIRRLEIGRWLETAADAEVRVRHADIGSVTIGPRSRLRLLAAASNTEHRLELSRGRIEALITAPPRLFFVNTPSAVAVDLGCAYLLEVDESGNGLLEVVFGWVALERDRSSATVPMGGVCRLRAGRGPGTPYFTDSTSRFRDAVERFDDGADAAAALEVLLREAHPRDTMTLWNLLPRVDGEQRRRVVDRMIALAGAPEVSVEGILRLDETMLEAWWNDLELDW